MPRPKTTAVQRGLAQYSPANCCIMRLPLNHQLNAIHSQTPKSPITTILPVSFATFLFS
jgi:hypothetical protein